MIGIYFICFIIFPIAVFVNTNKRKNENVFLNKQDVDVVKGIATCFVILAHLTIPINTLNEYNRFLKVFNPMGGIGVLLFFFVSGYGLFKGYRTKQIDAIFWKRRLVNMYFPCVIIQLIFCLIWAGGHQTFNILDIILSSLLGAWFIDVILIQYFIFFLSGKVAKGNADIWIILNFLCSIMVVFAFVESEFNARWYNGLLLFPFGMLIAYKEDSLIALIKRKWNCFFIVSTILFMLSGGVFARFKGNVAGIDAVKTFSGICLSLMVCIVFLRIKFCSKIMLYIGKRSLYFYLIHVNILSVLETIGGLNEVSIFYVVIILTFPISEIFYRLCFGSRK